jgi:hypothetical protein
MEMSSGTAGTGAPRCHTTSLSGFGLARLDAPPAGKVTPYNVITSIGRYRENYRIVGYLPPAFLAPPGCRRGILRRPQRLGGLP